MLDLIKSALQITWCPPIEEARLIELIAQGQAFLLRYDPTIEWDTDFEARSLLVEYVRYARANARDDFSMNYAQEILSLNTRQLGRKEKYDAETESAK